MVTSQKNGVTHDVFKAWLVENADFSGKYEFPTLHPYAGVLPDHLLPFDKALSAGRTDHFVHFYLHDEKFERFWNRPKAYLPRLARFAGVIAPDFSLYRDMPLSMQIWNTYRGRALAFWLQQNGVSVIPNISWGDERSYAFCFDGIPQNSTVAVSTYGCIQNKTDRYYFKQGLRAMVEKLSPNKIVCYSAAPEDVFVPTKEAGIPVIPFPNWNDVVRGKVPS